MYFEYNIVYQKHSDILLEYKAYIKSTLEINMNNCRPSNIYLVCAL